MERDPGNGQRQDVTFNRNKKKWWRLNKKLPKYSELMDEWCQALSTECRGQECINAWIQ